MQFLLLSKPEAEAEANLTALAIPRMHKFLFFPSSAASFLAIYYIMLDLFFSRSLYLKWGGRGEREDFFLSFSLPSPASGSLSQVLLALYNFKPSSSSSSFFYFLGLLQIPEQKPIWSCPGGRRKTGARRSKKKK